MDYRHRQRDDEDTSLRVNALFTRRLMLAEKARERLDTIAFGLMALTAYRLGFDCIALLAAGVGRIDPAKNGGFVGIRRMAKARWDAGPNPAERSAAPTAALRVCRLVQPRIAIDPRWWATHCRNRGKRFNLAAASVR